MRGVLRYVFSDDTKIYVIPAFVVKRVVAKVLMLFKDVVVEAVSVVAGVLKAVVVNGEVVETGFFETVVENVFDELDAFVAENKEN